MKRIAAIAVIALAVMAIAIATAPLIVPDGFLKQRVAEQIARLTGRSVTLTGGVNLSIYPNVSVAVDGLTVANPEGMGDDPFIAAEGLRARVRLLPLLLARVEFDEYELVKPRIHLVVNANGDNWRLSGSAVAADAAAPPPTDTTIAPPDVRIGRLKVTNGTILYDDLTSDRREEIAAVDFDIAWPSAGAAASGRGVLEWRGETVEFTGLVGAPLELMGGGTSPVRFAVASTALRATFTGTATGLDTLQLAGETNLSTPALRRALEWVGTPMGAGSILGAASIKGVATMTARTIQFEHAAIELDGNVAEGALAFDFTGERPAVQGTIAVEKLDLSPYLEAARADLTATGPWLTAPARLGFAQALDADMRISAGQVIAGATQLGKTAASVTINNGLFELAVGDAEFYGGRLEAQLTARMTDAVLSARTHVALTGVPAWAALSSVAGITALDGTMTAILDLTSQSPVWGGFASAIAGSGSLTIANGTLNGFDVAKIGEAFADPLAEPVAAGSGATPFARLGATFTVAEGRLDTDDLTMAGGAFTLSLKGSGSLLNGGVKATARLTTGGADLPLVVSGTWREPMIGREAAQSPAPTGG